MRTSTKHNNYQNHVYYITITFLLVFFNFPFHNGKCDKNVLTEEAEYSSITNELIRSSLENCKSQVVWLEDIELLAAPLICTFYEKNNYTTVWTSSNEINDQAKLVMKLLNDAYKYGFDPVNFDIARLSQYSNEMSKETQIKKLAKIRARFEFLLTNSVFTFMAYISSGTEYVNTNNVFLNDRSFAAEFPEYLNIAISSEAIKEEILKLQPDESNYIVLQSEMENIVTGMLTPEYDLYIPDGIDSLSQIFIYLFNIKGMTAEITDFYNPDKFVTMLSNFQNKLGLRPTGKIDGVTRKAISNLIQSRYSEIARSLEVIRKVNNSVKKFTTLTSYNSL